MHHLPDIRSHPHPCLELPLPGPHADSTPQPAAVRCGHREVVTLSHRIRGSGGQGYQGLSTASSCWAAAIQAAEGQGIAGGSALPVLEPGACKRVVGLRVGPMYIIDDTGIGKLKNLT